MRRVLLSLVWSLASVVALGRGESWVPKPPKSPAVETLTNAARYIEWKWRTDVTDPQTGLNAFALRDRVEAIVKEREATDPWCIVKARCYAEMCDKMSIGVSPHDWFPAIAVWNRYQRPFRRSMERRRDKVFAEQMPATLRRMNEGNKTGKWMHWIDFDHSVPEWEKILKLGFPGMRRRMRENWREEPRYRALAITSDATLRLIGRFVDYAKASPDADSPRMKRQVAALEQLAIGAPRTAYEAMEFIFLYFFCSEHLDVMQCRSLSIIDKILWPYYEADLAAGRTTETEFREQFRHFLWQWGSVDNYWGQPVTMGGTKADGTTEYNPLSMIILDVMDECALPTPKFHLKIADNTPKEILLKSLDMARRHRSLSFCGEKPIRCILMHCGYTADEARRFYTKGCYEFCCPEGANGTGVGYVNLLKPVETLLAEAAAGRFKAASYEDFERAYRALAVTNMSDAADLAFEFEKRLTDINPANFSTLADEHAVKTGKDAFSDGALRGNNTSILTVAFGTAVDALMAVREIVYEKREMSLADLGHLMAANWDGRDDLRMRMLRSKCKWGNNDPVANAAGARLSKAISAAINGRPNSRGGKFYVSGHCARQFVIQGALIGATPDGRRRGDETSKNLSATMGADTEGVTALVKTLGSLDSRDWPGDFPLDVMILPSAVAGEKGLEMMKALVFEYFEQGGALIQFNVFDAAELKDAQNHPEKYENLQVRVCGWNVRWNDLPKVEQDAYIRRAEAIVQ